MYSTELCQTALGLYAEALRRLPEWDPDVGLGETFVSGFQAIEMRRDSTPWEVSGERLQALEDLFVHLQQSRDLEIIDAIEEFPRAFLMLLERRHVERPGRPLRRWLDRVVMPVAH